MPAEYSYLVVVAAAAALLGIIGAYALYRERHPRRSKQDSSTNSPS
jgi:hypothetical protein